MKWKSLELGHELGHHIDDINILVNNIFAVFTGKGFQPGDTSLYDKGDDFSLFP